MSDGNEKQISELRKLLEAEISRQVSRTSYGCWPLLIALAGLILGIVLLVSGPS